MRFLIVDDQPSARMLLRQYVTEVTPGAEIIDKQDPQDVVELCRQAPPDMVILDYQMPGLDGLKLTRELRQDAALSDIPLIVVTVTQDDNLRATLLEAGADAVLVKPFLMREFRAVINRKLDLYQRLKQKSA